MGERSKAALAILLTASLLMLPVIVGPVRLNDSFWIDWVWLDQFADQLRAGYLYPRWLPHSHDGLGSPVFYFYPPLSFYLGSLFVLLGSSTWGGVVGAFWAAMVGSGFAMWAWLKAISSQRPLLGALLFMAAPYHLVNLTLRGALAEFTATAIIPLVALGLWWTLNRAGKRGPLLLATAYAALIATHLPLALLTSVFLLAPWLLMSVRQRSCWTRAAPALAAGIALAAIFLLPALLLDHARNSQSLWAAVKYRPQNWTLWAPSQTDGAILLFAVPAMGCMVAMAFVLLRHRNRLAFGALLVAGLALGLIPFIWQLPLLSSVQFPFRLLPVAEFLAATALATVPASRGLLLRASLVWLVLTSIIATHRVAEGVDLPTITRQKPEVPENLPPGNWPYSWPSRYGIDLAAKHRVARQVGPTTIEPRFYFPAVAVRCGGREVAAFMDPATGLLAHRGGPGCTLAEVSTAPERAGLAISLASLIALLLWSLRKGKVDARRRERPFGSIAPVPASGSLLQRAPDGS